MIQNDIEINIINSNNDVSRLPFDFFSKKRIVNENKNQSIPSLPKNDDVNQVDLGDENNNNNNNNNKPTKKRVNYFSIYYYIITN